MNQTLALFLLLSIATGCSGSHVPAKWAVVQAEGMFVKASEMRHDKNKHAARIRLYERACVQFVKAYELDPEVFTLYRIENAITACAWAENYAAKEIMQNFELDYIEQHPTEAEYGDAMPPMSFE